MTCLETIGISCRIARRVLATLALSPGQGSVEERFLQRLKMYRYICGLPYGRKAADDFEWPKRKLESANDG